MKRTDKSDATKRNNWFEVLLLVTMLIGIALLNFCKASFEQQYRELSVHEIIAVCNRRTK